MNFVRVILFLLTISAGLSETRAAAIRVDPDTVLVESFRGWGTSLCWWANVIGGLENHEEFADAIFTDLGLTIVRYNIGGGENPAYPELPADPRARMEGFLAKDGTWNPDADANQRRILRAAIARGVKHVDAFSNSPPWWMTESGSVTGGLIPIRNNLATDFEKPFADYLVAAMRFLSERDNVRFDTIAPMNEPLSPWWYGNRQEGCHMNAAQQVRVLDHLHTALARTETPIGLVAPETFSAAEAVHALKEFPPEIRGRLRAVAVHGYDTAASSELRIAAGATPVWMSEYGDGDRSGMSMVRAILDHLNILRVEEWVVWQAVEPDNGWGLVINPIDGESTQCKRTPKFHLLRQFVRAIPPGSRIVSTHDSSSVAAFPPDDDSLVVVALNSSDAEESFLIDLSASPPMDDDVHVVQTTPGNPLAAAPPLTATNGRIEATLPPRSLTTFRVRFSPTPPADASARTDPA